MSFCSILDVDGVTQRLIMLLLVSLAESAKSLTSLTTASA